MKAQNVLAILILKVVLINSIWSPPYLQSMHEKVDVSYQNGSMANSIEITILMDEEIPPTFSIASLTGYTGTNSPSIASFILGSNSNLGLNFELNSTIWQMVLTRQQNYENTNMQQYVFSLSAIDGILSTFIVRVRNIFDNPPTIVQHTNPCVVKEYEDPNFDSGCIFEVRDVDGMENNTINFMIANTVQEYNLFTFQEVSGSKTEFFVNYTLIVKESLNYTSAVMYMFGVDVSDFGNNITPLNVIVQVKNVASRLPVWIQNFSPVEFLEKEPQQFSVYAIDGDRGINDPIYYRVIDNSSLISIGQTTGIIDVLPIDRDAWKKEIFAFDIIAFKSTNESFYISSSAVLIVQDKNDNAPLINSDSSKNLIKIWEAEFTNLFESSELSVNDIDLGVHATYSVSLLPDNFAVALNIIPNSGYQLQNFTISVARTELLDYENETWRTFNITIKSEEIGTTEAWFDTKEFQVELLNWNDELPIFENAEYEFSVNETIGIDELIDFIKANDKDANETLVYFLTGRIMDTISINSGTGELRTHIINAFDYERQTDVYFQAFVNDTLQTRNEPTHTAFTQIHITVLDINDTPPQLILPQGVLKVKENYRNWTYTITATDPDTTADLEFFILWDNSSVSGSNTNPDLYRESLIIELDPVTNINRVTGSLKVNPDFPFNINYEEFHFMYIMIGVRDKNTVVNENSSYAMLTIEIEDENDNAPEFIGNTLTIRRSVIEEAEELTFIGTILARDIDGPGNNEITYSMIPFNNGIGAETPDGWITIDSASGDIYVAVDKEISCDKPNERQTLDFTVILFDGVWTENGTFSINIIDVNNKFPQIDDFISKVDVYENATDIFITKVLAHDDDRDEPNNVLAYTINNFLTADFFEIDLTTGDLRVKNLTNSFQMDRDNGIAEHVIHLIINDNGGIRLTNSTSVTLKLLDCNDNAPQMPELLEYPTIFESLAEENVVVTDFYAFDKDEGLNAQVDYEIESIELVEFFGDGALPTGFENLFKIFNKDSYRAEIKTGINLRGFSGKWRVNILATDRGSQSDAGVSQDSRKDYEITIEPFNFDAPVIVYPVNDQIIRADLEQVRLGSTLTLLDGSLLRPFEAIDNDVGVFGDVTFEINSLSGDHEFFELRKLNKSHSNLLVNKEIEEKTYTLSFIASDGENRNSATVSNVRVIFVNRTSDPIFEVTEFTTDFTENEDGLNEVRFIPLAIDPKNFGDPLYQIYYFIDSTFNPNDALLFDLDKTTRQLKLTQTLNREEFNRHQIRVIASNFATLPPAAQISETSMLIVNVNVNDVNDNSPKFEYQKYEKGISESDNLEKDLITFFALDLDLDDKVTYYLLTETLTVSNEDLEPYKNNAFELDSNTGILKLKFQVQPTLSGFFKFEVEARDLVNHTDRTFVTIYVISESSRFSFLFSNTTDQVKSVNQQRLVEILSEQYEAECVNDEIKPLTNEDGLANETLTVYRAHFRNGDDVANASYIENRGIIPYFLQDIQTRIRNDLGLVLYRVPLPINQEAEISQTLEISLAIVSGVLGLLLIAVIFFHIIQMKNYNRQIKALSQSSFDPNILNVKILPTQNLYSTEKSNPAMTNADFGNMEKDNQSIISQDSDDFAGLENNPIFDITSGVDEKPKNPLSQNGTESPRKDSSTFA